MWSKAKRKIFLQQYYLREREIYKTDADYAGTPDLFNYVVWKHLAIKWKFSLSVLLLLLFCGDNFFFVGAMEEVIFEFI